MIQSMNYINQLPYSPIHELGENHESEKVKQFEIHALQWVLQNQLNISPHRIDYFEIIWVKKGSVLLSIDSQKHFINDNMIYCLVPGQLRYYQANSNFIEGYYISFSADFLYMAENYTGFSFWLEQYDNNMNLPIIHIDDTETQYEIEEIIKKMKREFVNYFSLRSEVLKGLLNILILYFSRNIEIKANTNPSNKDAELMRKFMQLIKKHFIYKKMVTDYADELCITPNYLNRIVKKMSGFTASHLIQQQIVLEAKRQAIYSNVSMKEIAYHLGFDNTAHFSKFFKNNSGMNFTKFKKEGVV